MHELSIAQNVVDYILEEADSSGARSVKSVTVEVGELMQLDRAAFRQALRILMTGRRLGGARLSVRLRGASFSCAKCGKKWGMSEAKKQIASTPNGLLVREPDGLESALHFLPYLYQAFIRCPRCRSSEIAVESGKDLRVRRLEFG